MTERVEQALLGIRAKLGTADIKLIDINGGTVTLQYFKQLSACDVKSRGMITKDLVLEMIEEELSKEVPEIKEVIII